MGMFNTIVVAVDFSDTSRDVFRYALRLAASAASTRLDVLHVVPDPLLQPWSVEAAGIDFAALKLGWVSEANRRLNELMAAEGAAASMAKPVVLVGVAGDTIVRHATDLSADAIVMGTHGYGPIKRFILGSVTERVLRQALCPVLTVPHRSLKPSQPAS